MANVEGHTGKGKPVPPQTLQKKPKNKNLVNMRWNLYHLVVSGIVIKTGMGMQ